MFKHLKNHFSPCTIDFSPDLSASEIQSEAESIRTLLKAPFLVGTSKDLEGTIQSLFDIAEEISGVDVCAYFSRDDFGNFHILHSRSLPLPEEREELLQSPGVLVAHFRKAIILDTSSDPRYLPVCAAWNASSLLAFPLWIGTEIVGLLVFGKKPPEAFQKVQIKLLWTLSTQAENLLQDRSSDIQSYYTFLDPLTHLHNRRYLEDQIAREISRSQRSGSAFSLLLFDLDGLKEYNGRFGKNQGDLALQEFASLLIQSVREVDIVARVGPDEFGVLILDTYSEGAADLAHRVLAKLRRHRFPGKPGQRTESLSASGGIVTFPTDAYDRQDLLQKASRALFLAKSQAPGNLVLFQEAGPETHPGEGNGNEHFLQKTLKAARSLSDPTRFLEILLLSAMHGLGSDRASIVHETEPGRVTILASRGLGNGEESPPVGIHFPPGHVTNWVLAKRQPLIAGPGAEENLLPVRSQWKGYRNDWFLSVPLAHGGRVFGTMNFSNRKDDSPFTHEDLASLESLLGSIAESIYLATGFRETLGMLASSLLRSLAVSLELRFPFLSDHSRRVRDLSLGIGRRLNLPESDLQVLEQAAWIHDIGAVGIPPTVFRKIGPLTNPEWDLVRRHPLISARLLEGGPLPEGVRKAVQDHHELLDGSGYPFGLRGHEISMCGRILGVAEFFDSFTSDRPYRKGVDREEALKHIETYAGTLYDPEVCYALFQEVRA